MNTTDNNNTSVPQPINTVPSVPVTPNATPQGVVNSVPVAPVVNNVSVQPVINNIPVQPVVNNVPPMQYQNNQYVDPNQMAGIQPNMNVMPNNMVQDPNNQQVSQVPNNNQELTKPIFTDIDPNMSDGEYLLKAYIGDNYDKFINKTWNFGAFFFSIIYLLFRKMVGYTVLFFIICLILLCFMKTVISFALLPIIVGSVNILLGIFANKMYVHFARKKVDSIIMLNYDKGFEELKQICTLKGGTSIGSVFLGLGIGAVMLALYLVVVLLFCYNSPLLDIMNIPDTAFAISPGDESNLVGIWTQTAYKREKEDKYYISGATFQFNADGKCYYAEEISYDGGAKYVTPVTEGRCYLNRFKKKFKFESDTLDRYKWIKIEYEEGNTFKIKNSTFTKVPEKQ